MNFKRLISACMPALILMASPLANAASGDGSLVGRLSAQDQSAVAGAEVTARNPATGFSRKIKADADGSFRFPFMPVGTYTIEASKDGKSLGSLADVAVNLGVATNVEMDLGDASLEVVTVVGSRVVNAVDVTSTESATNISRMDVEQLPVDKDLLSVARLAPGVVRGHNFGSGAGVSFGGSSVAENTIYINGLNVTDFYNRIGFSSVPYAFYDEFQVKTGGYSVEFGRTTGGVINAVTRKGTNDFKFGGEVTWEPNSLQATKSNQPGILGQYDGYDRTNYDVYASGPIIQDKLFFFALYEFRDYNPWNSDNRGEHFDDANEDDDFWGAKFDWSINDRNHLELLAFSDGNQTITDTYAFLLDTGKSGDFENRRFETEGGDNWAVTYTSNLTDTFSAKVLYGENERNFSRTSQNDIDCSRVRDALGSSTSDVGCTNSPNIVTRADKREAARIDFEWALGSHQLRFGMDRESNVSQHNQFYPGPDRLLYEVRRVNGATMENGVPRPAGINEFVRTRQNEVDGSFETLNSAFYLEDNWSATDTLVLNAGVRVEGFDNRNSDGDSYIKLDNMIAPRFGFSWDMKGDGRTKLFGNVGRYFLPVANVINIKQAGGFLDARNWYVFNGWETFDYNGGTYRRPILGTKVGPEDTSQGDGSVGDLRAEVDKNMDPVYQDEIILGFQTMINEQWSWGARATYRKLTNAIDDMAITSTGIICDGEPVSNGYIMGNPGKTATIFSDTDCDGENDAYVDVDTSQTGWAMYSGGDYIGDQPYEKPRRNYSALELALDRAWDGKWSMNVAYTLAYNKGNAEGPVNTDTDFGDTGRTENFDDPWVNYGGYGYLPNDRRHQIKLRGAYGFLEDWRVGLTVNASSGRPISAFGTNNPFDDEAYHTYFICTADCGSPEDAQYELLGRGSMGRTPWIVDVGASVSWAHKFNSADVLVKLAFYNLLNQERVLEVDEDFDPTDVDNTFGVGTSFVAPRYGQLTLQVNF
jgi:hypothetical protein